VDSGGLLTNEMALIARRAFEWLRGEAYKVRLELKYPHPSGDPNLDFTLLAKEAWLLSGTGSSNLLLDIPEDGIMTGTNLYWSMFVYGWDVPDPWAYHGGFYTSVNDAGTGTLVSIDGKGLQIFGVTGDAFAGRAWDLWAGYNTRGETVVACFGIKDRGTLSDEDNFNDGDCAGWTLDPDPNVSWSVESGHLKASVVSGNGNASTIIRDGVTVTGRNVTVEYDVYFGGGATNGGLLFGGVVLDVNPARIGWRDTNETFVAGSNVMWDGAWHHVVLNVHEGSPHWLSDLYVDTNTVFVAEPIEAPFTDGSFGFESPRYSGYTEWDNVRAADEQYVEVSQSIQGEKVPTNESDVTFWPFVPDYDPNTWEHDGSMAWARYEWYVYMKGEGVHAYSNVDVYFAPRLIVESDSFPTNMHPGDVVQLPVEWEHLESLVPVHLYIQLQDPYTGSTYVDAVFTVTNGTGQDEFSISLPVEMPCHANYAWVAYMAPTNASDPFGERIGLDDTFYYDAAGLPVGPETVIRVTNLGADEFPVYNDQGIPGGCDIYTWAGGPATFDGDYTGETPPEGTKCFLTDSSSWAGWGVFDTTGSGFDMTEYNNGLIRLWVKSTVSLKVQIEDMNMNKATMYICSSLNQWKLYEIPLAEMSGFSQVDLGAIKGLIEVTSDSGTTFYVDDVRWVKGN